MKDETKKTIPRALSVCLCRRESTRIFPIIHSSVSLIVFIKGIFKMILVKCRLKPARETFPYKLVTYRIHWSHTGSHRLHLDLCICVIYIWSLFTGNTLYTSYCHSTHPFTMEERKVNIVQRHTWELFMQDSVFH